MYKRDVRLYLNDIQESIAAIEGFTRDIDYEYFHNDRKTYSATLREFIVHEYFGVDPRIVWDAVQHELPLLKAEMASLRAALSSD